jgi:hypothetical protein
MSNTLCASLMCATCMALHVGCLCGNVVKKRVSDVHMLMSLTCVACCRRFKVSSVVNDPPMTLFLMKNLSPSHLQSAGQETDGQMFEIRKLPFHVLASLHCS